MRNLKRNWCEGINRKRSLALQLLALAFLSSFVNEAVAQDVYNFHFEKGSVPAETASDQIEQEAAEPRNQAEPFPAQTSGEQVPEDLAPIRLGFDLQFGSWINTGFRLSTRF